MNFKQLALVGFLTCVILVTGCTTTKEAVYTDPDTGTATTNLVTEVDPKLAESIQKALDINDALATVNPYADLTATAIGGVGLLFGAFSTFIARRKNAALRTVVKGVESLEDSVAVKAAISKSASTMGTTAVTKKEVTKAKG